MKRFILICIIVLALCTSSYAQISTISIVTADDVTIDTLESNRVTLTDAINSSDGGLLQDESVTSAKLTDNANPENRWDEAFSDFVYTGLLPSTSSSLTTTTSAGTAYVHGTRVVKDSTSHLYTADRYTYVDLSNTGVFTYSIITTGGSVPAVALNSIRLCYVSTDATTVSLISDERTTTLTSIASASKIVDTTGNTQIQTEETAGEDIIRFDTASVERLVLDDTGLGFKGSTSGTTTLKAAATAGTGTLTLDTTTGTLLSTGSTRYFVGTFTHDMAATGDQQVTGVGFTPQAIITFGGEQSTRSMQWSMFTSADKVSLADQEANSGDTYELEALAIKIEDAAGIARAIYKSFDADGFTVTWSKTSSPAGTATIYYMALR